MSAPGWSSTAGSLSAAINEATADDASYITSPDVSGTADPFRFSIGPVASGTVTKTVRARRTGAGGEVRLVLLSSGGATVGESAWQSLTADWAAYPLSVTLTGAATQGEIQVRGTAAFDPLSLFASGEQGAWYDPSDLTTLFQDAAGTTPVTAAGQPVGRMLDKSGNGHHVLQSTGSLKPALKIDASGRYYLEFDGVDDVLISSGNSQLTEPVIGVFYGCSFISGYSAVWATSRYKSGNYDLSGGRFTTLGVKDYDFPGQYSSGAKVVPGYLFASDFGVTIYKNGVAGAIDTHHSDTSNSDSPIRLGQMVNGADRFEGSLYQLVIRRAAFSTEQINQLSEFINIKTGAY